MTKGQLLEQIEINLRASEEKDEELRLEAEKNGINSPRASQLAEERTTLTYEADLIYSALQMHNFADDAKTLVKTRADYFADSFREAVRITDKEAWHIFFADGHSFRTIEGMTKEEVREVNTIAQQLAQAFKDLHQELKSSLPESSGIPALLQALYYSWSRWSGIHALRYPDFYDYTTQKVAYLLPEDKEATQIALNITGYCLETRHYLREIFGYLRHLGNLPPVCSISLPLHTDQLRKVYNRLVENYFIEGDHWEEFITCFDDVTPSQGCIYWKKRQPRNRSQAYKRAMCDLLRLLGIEYKVEIIGRYVRNLFKWYDPEIHQWTGVAITNKSIYEAYDENKPTEGSEYFNTLKDIIEGATKPTAGAD